MDKEMIAKALANFRNNHLSFSQEGVADAVGMTQRTWGNWEKAPPQAITWLVALAVHHGVSTDYILGLTNNPRSASNDTLPDGAAEVIEYLAGMSPRGRRQLLRVAQVLYEEDKRWKRHDAVLRYFASVAGKTTLANLGGDNLPAMLAEFGTREALSEYVDQTFTEDVRGNEGQEV